jgi:CBS domain-containing protein
MKAKDIMTANPESVTPGTNIADVAQIMRDMNVGVVPVAEDDRLLGVITDRDITIRVTAAGMAPQDVTVQDFMSPNVVTVSPEDSVEDVRKVMADNQIRRVMVTDGEKLVGVISLGDVALNERDKDAKTGEVLEKVSEPTNLNRMS